MDSRRVFLGQGMAASLALATGSWAWCAPAPRKPKDEADPKLFTPEVRKAVDKALKFLADNQNADGSFGTRAYAGNVAVTSLPALALLTAGHPPDGTPRGKVVSKALDFVLSQEDPDGTHPGYFHNSKAAVHGPMYGHGFATLFLACLHGAIKDKKKSAKVDEALGRAVKLTASAQNAEGGWRYTPVSRDADISVTACQMKALLAARKAGVKVPGKTMDQGVAYVLKCRDAPTGGVRYMARGGVVGVQAFARTAAAVLVLQAAGYVTKPEVKKGLDYLVKNRPVLRFGRPDMHYFYGHSFAAPALHAAGGAAWKEWYGAVWKELLDSQAIDGSWRDQICSHYATAMACLILLTPNGRLMAKLGLKRK